MIARFVALSLLALTALVAPLAPAKAEWGAVTANRWETYTNTRYGVMIDYPADLFAIEPPPPDNAGREFNAAALKARFHIYSHANALDASRDELEAEDVLDLGDAAAKKQNGSDWYQVVAIKGGETTLRRVLLSEGGAMVHRLEIAFPTGAANALAPIVERMTKSFRVDPTIPEQAATDASNKTPHAPSTNEWQQFDSIALGLRIPGYDGKAGMSGEVPASWTRSDMPEPNVISFTGPQASDEDDLHVVFRIDLRRPNATLVSEAKIIKDRLAEGADNYRLLSERMTRIASRPAIVFSMQFSGSDSPALLREDVAIIDGGKVFYSVSFGAPQARYATVEPVFAHILKTISIAE